MPKYQVITDPETAAGFRLSGVDVFTVRDNSETEGLMQEILDRGECALLLINEHLLEQVSVKLHRRIERTSLPLVVPVPLADKWWKEERGMEYLLRLIRRAIGYQMKIKK